MISKNFALNITSCLSGDPFTLDELIMEVKSLFEAEGVPGFLRVLLALIDDVVVRNEKSSPTATCCSNPCFVGNGKRTKKLNTGLGLIDFEWSLLRCKNCGASHHPLKVFLGIDKYQKVSCEFEKICMETIAKESFRKSAQTLRVHINDKLNHRSLHRWFMRTEADEIKVTLIQI